MYVMVHNLFIGGDVYSLSIEHVVNSCVSLLLYYSQSLVPYCRKSLQMRFPKTKISPI